MPVLTKMKEMYLIIRFLILSFTCLQIKFVTEKFESSLSKAVSTVLTVNIVMGGWGCTSDFCCKFDPLRIGLGAFLIIKDTSQINLTTGWTL